MTKTYRQLSHKLRIQRGPGRPDKNSIRPRKGSREMGWGEFLDSDDEPTLVTFDEHDQVNVQALLASGAIAEWKPVVSTRGSSSKTTVVGIEIASIEEVSDGKSQ